MKRFVWYLTVMLLVLGSVSWVKADTIGLDGRNYYQSVSGYNTLAEGPDYKTFREIITSSGHSIVPLTSFLAADLTVLDAIFLKQPYDIPYSQEEINAIHAFVSNGGGVAFLAEDGIAEGGTKFNVENMNALVSAFGVTYSSVPVDELGREITGFIPHPVTKGLSSIGVDYQLPMISINPPSMALTTDGGSDNALAAVTGFCGSGNVVFLSDSSLWLDPDYGSDTPITFLGNELLLRNVIDFITTEGKPEPRITVNPVPIAFGEVCVGQAAELTVSIGNSGCTELNVTDITSDLGALVTISETTFTVAPGAAHDITLTLTANVEGEIKAHSPLPVMTRLLRR